MSAAGRSGGGAGRGRASASASWRDDALRSLLDVAAIVAPPASVLAVLVRAPPRPVLDTTVILAVGIILPMLRFLGGVLPFKVRAGATLGVIFGAAVFVLARVGMSPGASLLFAISATFGALYFGRFAGYAVIGLSASAFLLVGWLASQGHLTPVMDMWEVRRFENWFRVGAIFALLTTLLTSIVTFVVGRAEASARDLRVAYERLGQLHRRLESTKEEERRFLAHELHDELGQLLTALKLRVQLRARNPAAAPGPEDDPIAVIDDLIARVRRMSGDLRPPLLDEVGLVPAVRAYLDAQSALSGVAMTLETDEATADGTGSRLGADLEITCFRIVQEAITNAIRHAAARDLRVRMERKADRLSLRIRDDGRGFDVDVRLDGAAAAGHLGVVGMRERVLAHGGDFRLLSRPGAGTTIEVELPLAAFGPPGAAAVT